MYNIHIMHVPHTTTHIQHTYNTCMYNINITHVQHMYNMYNSAQCIHIDLAQVHITRENTYNAHMHVQNISTWFHLIRNW